MPDLVRLIARLPPELHAAVKVEAARRRRSVQSIVIEVLARWVEEREAEREGWDPMEASDAGD